MNKTLYFLLFCGLFFSSPVMAEEEIVEDFVVAEQSENVEADTETLTEETLAQQSEETEEDDDLYIGTEVVPYEKERTLLEQDSSNHIADGLMDEQIEFPELSCDDPKLKSQVMSFIQNSLKERLASSVIEKRKWILLVKNLNDFEEVDRDEVSTHKSFATASILTDMSINKKQDVYKICRSKKNSNSEFENTDIIIYKTSKFYNVIIANIARTPDNVEEATFIYSW